MRRTKPGANLYGKSKRLTRCAFYMKGARKGTRDVRKIVSRVARMDVYSIEKRCYIACRDWYRRWRTLRRHRQVIGTVTRRCNPPVYS